ncbi:MAG: glycosyltransferase family 2 protein [bacterium]
MSEPAIVGVVLVKNEDLFIGQALENVTHFCDRMLVYDNFSTDGTYPILETLAAQYPHIHLERIQNLAESHRAIEGYAGTPTWIFAVDGDELYDPNGLREMRVKIKQGALNRYHRIYGNVLNCSRLDRQTHEALGYLSPPARSMTKLYNFAHLTSWTGCPQRLHNGTIVFKPGFNQQDATYSMHLTTPWETSSFRCLHMCMTRRSSKQVLAMPRFSPSDEIRKQIAQQTIAGKISFYLRTAFSLIFRKTGKDDGYRRGPQVRKDVSGFFIT